MPISKLQLLKTRVKALKSTLESATSSERKSHASTATTDHLNKIIDETTAAFPDIASSLPDKTHAKGPGRKMGISDQTFLDIEIATDQVLALLELIDEE